MNAAMETGETVHFLQLLLVCGLSGCISNPSPTRYLQGRHEEQEKKKKKKQHVRAART